MRCMTPADVPLGMKLKTFAGWNQTPADWQRFLAIEPEGCFVGRLDGEDAGTVTTIAFEKRFGWVGMVLVLPEKRRHGLGTALLYQGIGYLKSIGVETVRLDATPMGKLVYDRIGFRDEYHLERRQGRGQRIESHGCLAATSRDADDIIAFDAPRFGANRSPVLTRLLAENPASSLIHRTADGRLDGYIIARPGSNAFQVGPWLAESPDVAEELFKSVLNLLADKPIFFDVPLPNPHGVALAERYGFAVQRPFIRMYLGMNRHPGDPRQIYSTSGPEKG